MNTDPTVGAGAKKGLSPLAWVAIGCGGLVVVGGIVFAALTFFVFNKARDLAQEFESNPGLTAAEMMVRVNPELDLVESDEETGKMTIRHKESKQELTVDWQKIRDGELTFHTPEGEVSFQAEQTGDGSGSLVIQSGDERVDFNMQAQAGDEPASFSMTGKDGEVWRAEGRDDEGVTITSKDGTMQIGGEGADIDIPKDVPIYPGATPVGVFAAESGGRTVGAYQFEVGHAPKQVLANFESLLEGQGYEIVTQAITSAGGNAQGGMHAKKDGDDLTVSAEETSEGSKVTVHYNRVGP